MQVLSVYDVFTPSMPAREAFVERVKINDRLVDAIRTPGKQIVIYGHSGSGKSTLIERKLFETYENHVTVSCVKGMTFEAVMLDAFDQLDAFFVLGGSVQSSQGWNAQLQQLWITVSAAKSAVHETSTQRMLPPQLTVQNLARLIGAAKACWVLEDFHKLDPAEKEKLAQAMKMFMDSAKAFPSIKAVAVGAVGTAREVVAYDNEMRNRVAEVEVPLMDQDELAAIISTGASKLGISFEPVVSQTIVNFSNGIPAICHQLSLNACRAAGIEVSGATGEMITKPHLEQAIKQFVESASDSIRERFDRAVRRDRVRKYDNYILTLRALCEVELDGGATIGELVGTLAKIEPDYPSNNIGRYLESLMTDRRGGVVRRDPASGRFFFADPFIRSYSQAYFRDKMQPEQRPAPNDSAASSGSSVSSADFMREVTRYLDELQAKPITIRLVSMREVEKPKGGGVE